LAEALELTLLLSLARAEGGSEKVPSRLVMAVLPAMSVEGAGVGGKG